MLHMEKALCVNPSPELKDYRRGLAFVELAGKGCTSKADLGSYVTCSVSPAW